MSEEVGVIIRKVCVALDNHIKFYDYDMLVDFELDYYQWKQLLNYITNLQRENQQLKDRIDKALELLDNYQNNLYSKMARETLDDDIERTIKLLKGILEDLKK